MAVSNELLEEGSRQLDSWLGSYENAHAAEKKLIALDIQRGEVEEELQIAQDSQSKAENAVKGLLAEIEETPENMAMIEKTMAPYLARAEFLQVVS